MANEAIYSKATGTALNIYIEDDGANVRFYMMSTDPTLVINDTQFNYSYPQGKGSFKTAYPAGGTYKQIGPSKLQVQTSGKVILTLAPKHSDPRIGGPSTLSVDINRSGDPQPPVINSVMMINATTAQVKFQWDGASALAKKYEITYSRKPGVTGTIVAAAGSGTQNIGGLTANTDYYFHVRMYDVNNKVSKWSEPFGLQTSGGVMVFYRNMWKNAIPYVKVDGVWKRALAYIRDNGTWKITR